MCCLFYQVLAICLKAPASLLGNTHLSLHLRWEFPCKFLIPSTGTMNPSPGQANDKKKVPEKIYNSGSLSLLCVTFQNCSHFTNPQMNWWQNSKTWQLMPSKLANASSIKHLEHMLELVSSKTLVAKVLKEFLDGLLFLMVGNSMCFFSAREFLDFSRTFMFAWAVHDINRFSWCLLDQLSERFMLAWIVRRLTRDVGHLVWEVTLKVVLSVEKLVQALVVSAFLFTCW